MHLIHIKRSYEEPSKEDGIRVLVDRLWPRGISKEKAKIDLWLRDIAPSTELRKWFHKVKNWGEFEKHYTAELRDNRRVVEQLLDLVKENNATLIYSAKDTEYNNAVVLRNFLHS